MAYCHDGVGIGHLRRMSAILEHTGDAYPRASFLLATDSPCSELFDRLPRMDTLKLPAPARSGGDSHGSPYRVVSRGQLTRCRASLLERAAEYFDPDVFLMDAAPSAFCDEVLPTLRSIRQHRPDTHIVFGMSDIEDDPPATIARWTRDGVQEVLEDLFDEVWVYGAQELFDPIAEYRLSRRIQEKLRFMGYVARDPCHHGVPPSRHACEVLVTVGGGTDGETLLDRYLSQAAAAVHAMGGHSTIVGGPDLPKNAARRLRRIARALPGVEWLDFTPCMTCHIRKADLVVSMGGYNTLCELAVLRKPGLIVPRVRPRLEQAIRAELWSQHGVVRLLHPTGLTPGSLAHRVIAMLEDGSGITSPKLDLRGLHRIAERFDAFWSGEVSLAPALRP